MKIASFDIGIKNMAYCIFDISPSPERCWSVVDWNVVDLLNTTNQPTQKPVCGCLLKITKRKGKNDSSMNKTCGKKAKYLKSRVEFSYETPNVVSTGIPQFTYETPNVVSTGIPQSPETMTTHYFCEKHAKNETQYLLPSKEYTLAHLRKQKVDGIVELYERFCLSSVPEKKYPNKPEMIDSIMKYYTARLFSEIPVAKKNANDANLIQIGWAIRRIFDSSPHFSNITHVVIENQISPIASRMKTIQGMLAQYFIMKSTLEQPVEIVFVSSSNKLRLGEPAAITETKNKSKKNKEPTKESTLSFEDKSSPDNPRTPTLVPRSCFAEGVLTNTNNEINEIESLNTPLENKLVENHNPLSMNPNYKQHKKDGVALCSRFIESNTELSNWLNVIKENAKKDDLADCFLQGVWVLTNRNIITCAENLKINIV